MKLNDKKKILILGASSDIGIATINKYLHHGWVVIAHYNKNLKNLKKIKNKNLIKFKYNLENLHNFKKFIENKKFLRNLDAFISLTGLIEPIDFYGINQKNFTRHINVNYLSNILVLQKILPNMKKKNFGRIIFSSSVGVKFGGGSNSLIYSLTKHMNEFFMSEYKKYYNQNILINTLRIGVTDTKIHKGIKNKNLKKRIKLIPINRIAKASEVANYLYFYGTDQNSLTTNSIIEITGGE